MPTKLLATLIAIFLFVAVLMTLAAVRTAMVIFWAEKQEQAEVIGKRIEIGGEDNNDPYFFITFKFSDGSVKELHVSSYGPGRKVYDSFYEGDTGVLTYKEKEDIDEIFENKDPLYGNRRFISFEKDSEYGGIKIEKGGLSETVWLIIGIGMLVSWVIFFVVIIILEYKGKPAP